MRSGVGSLLDKRNAFLSERFPLALQLRKGFANDASDALGYGPSLGLAGTGFV
jgi:hypothetical protein